MRPLVTVVVSTYNAGDYLRRSLISIFEQSYSKLEVLLVDDGSCDGSIEGISGFDDPRLRIIRQENAGKSVALNRALRELRGEFYALCDADDLCHPRRIEHQLTAMEENPAVAAVFCGHDLILNDMTTAPRSRPKGPVACRSDIEQFRMPAHDPTAMYRVSMVRGIEYEPSLRIGQGLDYILRVGERHPMMVIGECLYSYRVHRTSVTKRDPQARDRAVAEVRRRACERRGLCYSQLFEEEGESRSTHERADNNLAAHFIESAVDQARSGHRLKAIRTGLECVRLHPLDPHYHKAWVLAATPVALHRYVRQSAAST
jgi:glycosyltransferase involved in cell wall biosynthesis